ncbi:MAG: glycosyltransferase family 2 protein [Planctomycetia bacterium]|jgi:glycosyltransferase involved in cell wall biosynthesis|nr:glycosyltransferase family 2 protein [Planctomycetia bacterium]MCC7316188.1 glycosyltransferase family 2 protein [Planctomycetota bacterium]OQY97341.1 MAG: cell wall biosynthesis glycosyltransferase [Planctomycetes bacterium UTPLA1]
MKQLPELSIFFPCYNEEANVERVARAAVEAASRFAEKFEIILVNDGSKDRTGEIAESLAKADARIRAVHNNPNLGYGGAVARGLRESRYSWIFFTDGDGQFDLNEMDKLINLLDRCDLAVGYRIKRADSFIRRSNAFFWGVLVRALFGLKVRDIDCAFKLLPKSLIDKIELRSQGALISTELLARAKYQGLRIAEVGVNHYPRVAGQQTGANIRVILRAFAELIRLRKHIRAEGLRHH